MSAVTRQDPAYAGQARYTRGFLHVYDALVYGLNAPLAWQCPQRRLVELYDANVSARHVDVGVATGVLLDKCRFPVPGPDITLVDVNQNSLARAARRLERYRPSTHLANVLEPWRLEPASAGSVAMFNLLHCLPGALPGKARVFEHAKAVLRAGGVLFGCTILGQGVSHAWLARRELAAANWRGFMSNRDDRLDDLESALGHLFSRHQVTIAGSMALFTAIKED